jgi:GNAT superfamily N-acetyltransferase
MYAVQIMQQNIFSSASGRLEKRVKALLIAIHNPLEKYDVLGLLVDKSIRRKGAAKLLLEKAFSHASELGFRCVETTVFADNKPMLITTLKLGFKPVRIDYHSRFDGEDSVILKKQV